MVSESLSRGQSELPPPPSPSLSHVFQDSAQNRLFLAISESCVVYSKNPPEEFTHQSPCCQEHGNHNCNTKDV